LLRNGPLQHRVNSAPRCSDHAGGMIDPMLPQGEREISRLPQCVNPVGLVPGSTEPLSATPEPLAQGSPHGGSRHKAGMTMEEKA